MLFVLVLPRLKINGNQEIESTIGAMTFDERFAVRLGLIQDFVEQIRFADTPFAEQANHERVVTQFARGRVAIERMIDSRPQCFGVGVIAQRIVGLDACR